ncbi:MAG: serine/threonine-protein kinase [Gemmataceae bacterium]
MISSPREPEGDSPAFDQLNDYLEELQSGSPPEKAKFLAEHPELASFVASLEALQYLSPGAPVTTVPAKHPDPVTVPFVEGPDHSLAATAEADGLPGALTDFGKYELLGELGRGGMGVVYKARQKDLDRLVAIKMILSSRLASAEHVSRFHAEARSTARIQHPHIVQVYETGQIHGQNYFAMEYIDGPNLGDMARDKKPSPEQAVRLLLPVVRAVGHLHAEGLIHRDLKPTNIIVDPQNRPVLTDFGLAKILDADSRLTCTGDVVGTPSYMAPEQATGSRDMGPWSDVYSLGAILYELLTGRPPFRAATPLDTLVQVMEGEPILPRELNPEIPRKLELICLKCLDKARERRYTDAAALAEDLEHFVHGDPVEAQPQGWLQSLTRWSRRQPALASHLGAFALAAAIVQVNYLFSHPVPLLLHLKVLCLLVFWAGVSCACQRALRRARGADLARFAWSACDVAVFTFLLLLTDNATSELLSGYALLVAMSALWFQERLVWFTTAVVELAFALLVLHSFPSERLQAHRYHILLFMAILLVQAFIMVYQVQRVRLLSRYYEGRANE